MATFLPIAVRELHWTQPGGACGKVRLALGTPVQSSNGMSWACPMAADGLFDNLPEMHGVDSWQALILALSVLKMIVKDKIEKGWTFHWPTPDCGAVDLEYIFGF